MTKTVDIQSVSRSAYDAAANDKLKALLDELIRAARGAANWKVRKKTLLDIISGLETATCALHEVSREEEEEAAADDEDPETFFMTVLPMYIGAILEKLEEPRISCIEQAAFYMISVHPEHQEAAQTWIDADFRHFKEFKRFLAANRYYQRILARGSDLVAESR